MLPDDLLSRSHPEGARLVVRMLARAVLDHADDIPGSSTSSSDAIDPALALTEDESPADEEFAQMEAVPLADAVVALRDALRLFRDSLDAGANDGSRRKQIARVRKRLARVHQGLEPMREAEEIAAWVESRLGQTAAPLAAGFVAAESRRGARNIARAKKKARAVTKTVLDDTRWVCADLEEDEPARFGAVLSGQIRRAVAEASSALEVAAATGKPRHLRRAAKWLRRVAFLVPLAVGDSSEGERREYAARALRTSRLLHRRLVPAFRESSLARALAAAGLAGLADQNLVAEIVPFPDSSELLRGRDELLEIADALSDSVEHAAWHTSGSEVSTSNTLPREIERKFLLAELPPYARETTQAARIQQGYVPGEKIHERVRSWTPASGDPTFTRTIKLGRGLSRIEVSEALEPEAFDKLWPLTKGKRVEKGRYRIPTEDLVWEIDEFYDRDLVLAEVELVDERQEVSIPDWLERFVVREVTNESDYVNLNLAR